MTTPVPWISSLLAASLSIVALPAHASATARSVSVEDPADSRTVRLEIDVEGLGGYPDLDPAVYEVMARTALVEILQARGFEVLDPKAPASGVDVVRLALAWRDFDASVYALTYYASPEGGTTQTMPEHLCEHCSDDDLIAAVGLHLDEALAGLEREDPPPEDPPPEDPPPEDPPVETTTHDSRPLRWAGVGLLAAGVAGAVTGGVLIAQGERREADEGGAQNVLTTDFRPPGYAALAGGGALLVTGAVLLILDHRKHRKSSAESTSRATTRYSLTPGVSPHGLHLGLTGRF